MRSSLRQLLRAFIISALGAGILIVLLPALGIALADADGLLVFEAGLLMGLVIFACVLIDGAVSRRPETDPYASAPREEGVVKWFNGTKGFGFITGDDGEDIFVHYRSVRSRDRYALREGMEVSYVLGRSGKGPQAEDVIPLDD